MREFVSDRVLTTVIKQPSYNTKCQFGKLYRPIEGRHGGNGPSSCTVPFSFYTQSRVVVFLMWISRWWSLCKCCTGLCVRLLLALYSKGSDDKFGNMVLGAFFNIGGGIIACLSIGRSGPTCPSGSGANDSVSLKLRIRVPTNAMGFSFQFRFFQRILDLFMLGIQWFQPGVAHIRGPGDTSRSQHHIWRAQ